LPTGNGRLSNLEGPPTAIGGRRLSVGWTIGRPGWRLTGFGQRLRIGLVIGALRRLDGSMVLDPFADVTRGNGFFDQIVQLLAQQVAIPSEKFRSCPEGDVKSDRASSAETDSVISSPRPPRTAGCSILLMDKT
jgi:hypothetical protein